MKHPPLCLLLFFYFSILSAFPLHAQQDDLKSIVHQLREMEIPVNPLPSTEIPPLAQQLLPKLKSGLREVILRSLNTHNVADPQILRDLILHDLNEAGMELSGTEVAADTGGKGEYGLLYRLELKQPSRHSDLVAIVTELGVPCGSDSSLNLFQRKMSKWEVLAVDESNGFLDITGAQGSFQFAISPPDEDGNWFVVTANVNPWCTSNWQQLRYKVFRPKTVTGGKSELLNEKTTVYLGVDEPYRIKIQPHGFEISNIASNSLDSAIFTRLHIQRYRVTNDSVQRIPPLALAPEDFLDEWVDMKWEEASKWVIGTDSSLVQFWHSRLTEDGRGDFYTEFEFAQPCPVSDDSSRWQVALSLEGGSERQLPEDLPDELFFTIVKRADSYFIESITAKRPPGCPGEARPRGAQEYLH